MSLCFVLGFFFSTKLAVSKKSQSSMTQDVIKHGFVWGNNEKT